MNTTSPAAGGAVPAAVPAAAVGPADRTPAAERRRGVLARTADLTVSGFADLVFSGVVSLSLTILVVTLGATGVGLAVLLVGLALLLGTLYLLRWSVELHRWKARSLYGVPTAMGWRRPPPHARAPGFGGYLARQWDHLKDGELWRGLGRMVAGAILGLVVLAFVVWAAQRVGILVAALARGYTGVPFGPWVLETWALALVTLLVVVLAVLACLLFAHMSRAMDAELLGAVTRAQYSERIDRLEGARHGAVSAAEDQRQRIERDLHDGVQPQLVNVAMTLDMARRAFATNPAEAQALLDEAHSSSKEAITSLRQTVRGIHPAVLTDRGLDAALSALAARSTVPVDLAVELDGRPGPEAEATVYFVVAEALNNVTKHAYASSARVTVRPIGPEGEHLQVVVSDDGGGGATLEADETHTGLRGIRDRLAAVGGSLTVTSPHGGPTTIMGELPCGS
ncbi:sensor histidine kinase [Georgenia sp. Z1344]|uniref:sensor histidine kinase n=1 Tax=Georgenia sp. Z1344 TaxID=3416706 RepID=UPI003CE7F3C3